MSLSFFLCLPRGCWKWNFSLYLWHRVLTERFLLWGKAQCFLSARVHSLRRPCGSAGERHGLALWLWPLLQIRCPDNKKPSSGKFHKTISSESQAAGRKSKARWYNIPQSIHLCSSFCGACKQFTLFEEALLNCRFTHRWTLFWGEIVLVPGKLCTGRIVRQTEKSFLSISSTTTPRCRTLYLHFLCPPLSSSDLKIIIFLKNQKVFPFS